ncbi:hypothetical protein LC55x_3708 [Lysobacter capsici]|nr:hypothetical protein LC55x_3708 [Lysobacter capsici]
MAGDEGRSGYVGSLTDARARTGFASRAAPIGLSAPTITTRRPAPSLTPWLTPREGIAVLLRRDVAAGKPTRCLSE